MIAAEFSAKMNKRPVSVTIIACLYLLVGAFGFAYHLTEFKAQHPFQYDIVWTELTESLAILCGAFMLRGHNWARWLAVAWMAFHVILSAFHSWFGVVVHALLCAAFAYFLFRVQATQFFRAAGAHGGEVGPTG